MSLLERARQGINASRQDQISQSIADEICSNMRTQCEKLLVEQGRRVEMFEEDQAANPFTRIIARLMMAGLYYPRAKRFGVSAMDAIDYRKLARTIDDGKDEPVEVTVTSDLAIPERSRTLLVQVKGLDEALKLYKNQGAICTWGLETFGQGNLFVPSRTIHGWIPARRATKKDADKWREEVVDKLTGIWKPYDPNQA